MKEKLKGLIERYKLGRTINDVPISKGPKG
jgi:hypothetical protein